MLKGSYRGCRRRITENSEQVTQVTNVTDVDSSSTFQVMKIVSDKQELGFVEKVNIPESQIAQICKHLVPRSIDDRNPDTKIKFQVVNGVSLPTVGIYGDKLMMARVLKNMRAINNSTYSTMLQGDFEAGLYLSPMEHRMVAFYWHQGTRMEEAARRQMSCNFIRYLVDLCDDVCVLVEEDNLMDVLSASASRQKAKQNRIKRLQISHVQNSSNDVSISPGFSLTLAMELMGLQNPQALFSVPIQGPFFSQGHHRCGYIAPAFKESRECIKPETYSFDPRQLPSKIKEWYQDYAVDFSGLKNHDFVLFLKDSGLPEFQKYQDFDNSMKSSFEQEQRQITSRLEQVENRIIFAFIQALPETCSFLKYLSDWGSEGAVSSLEQLEQVVAEAWGGRKLVFVGSEITFTYSNGSSFKGLIESEMSYSWYPKLITFGQTFMLRKASTPECQANQACFRKDPTGKEETPVLADEPVILVEAQTRKGGVITEVQTPSKAIRSWVEELVPESLQNTHTNIRFLCFLMSKGIAKQLKDLGEEFIGEVSRGKYFGKRLLQPLLENVGASNHHQISLKFNATKDFLFYGRDSTIWEEMDNAASKLKGDAKCKYEEWKKKFSDFKLDESFVSNGNLFVENWKTLCSEICDSLKDTFRKSVVSMIRREMTGFLQKRFAKTEEERRRLQERFCEKKDAFLQRLKNDVSDYDLGRGGDGAKRRRMYIKSYKINESFSSWAGISDPKIDIEVSTEEIEEPRVIWRFTEVAPTKRDLEQICLNRMHKINPLCSESFELLRMHPEKEELKMVACLKSGELLVFVIDKMGNHLNLYLSPKLGSVLSGINPMRVFRRGIDLIAFEESTRFLALYDAQLSKVSIYRFDEAFRQAAWTGVELSLDVFSGSSNLVRMLCIPGRSELLLLDNTNRIRIAELHHVPLMKPAHIQLSSEYISGCISDDGSFLFLLLNTCASTGQEISNNDNKGLKPCASIGEEQSNEKLHLPKVWIYLLGDTISFLKCILLDVSLQDATDLEMKLVNYGGQKQLVLFSKSKPNVLKSFVLEITLATEVLQVKELLKNKGDQERPNKLAASESSAKSSLNTLEYLYHIYDKFAVHPAMCRETKRSVNFHILLKPSSVGSHEKAVIDKCNDYLNSLLGRIKMDKGKDFCNYRIHLHTQTVDTWEAQNTLQACIAGAKRKAMGDWIKQLVCLVPVQICRADNNGIEPLVDGFQISSQKTYWDSISLANLVRFGMYDSILKQWNGCIKVISSMGKQSSGKSYLLNHLCGSLLDVAGGRCTDGVWLTVRIVSNCLYVILDFEGLGSFERSEQEDMLLSVLNAALSNLTIFNKKDFHLDKETETLFNRFQEGVSVVKHDEKLFKGLFYIAIKDVDVSDVEDLKDEFQKKLQQICERSKEDFISKMYRGEVVIATMPPFNRQEYHKDSLEEIAFTIENLDHSYEGGRSFLRDLKIVIAQIAAKDWTDVNLTRAALKIDVLRKNMVTAVKAGCLLSNGCLVNFDTDEEIPESPLDVADLEIDIADTGLELAPSEGSTNTAESILGSLRRKLEQVLERKGRKDEEWHAKFQEFLQALVKRRQERVQNWVHCNSCEFVDNSEVQKLQLEVSLAFAKVKEEMAVCGSKCSKCFWKCVLNKGHSSPDHSCMGSHVCAEKCSYCSMECGVDQAKVWECQSLAGHEGNHDCGKKNHICVKPCSFSSRSSTCSVTCSLKIGHEGEHRCNAPQHICNEKCSLPGCQNDCVIPIETGDHERHVCHERYCPEKCIMQGCRRRCGFEDHLHQLTSNQHLCGSEHSCPKKCEADGICEIVTELFRQTRLFSGKRSTFEYEHMAEQNGLRKNCCIPVPPFELCHEGAHVHTQKKNALHYCDVKCPACGYFCNQPINHVGLHKTMHGNMRNVCFLAETKEINIQNRKYEWGESCVAEMCSMHCKDQGRGHIHLIKCASSSSSDSSSSSSVCSISVMNDGARHQTKKYGPDIDVPKDELKHETYWQLMRFQDPYSDEDRKEFSMCNHVCTSDEHVRPDGKRTPSYCTEKLWHEPLQTVPVKLAAVGGHVQDGHAFTCNHMRTSSH